MESLQCVPIVPWNPQDTESKRNRAVKAAEEALEKLEQAIEGSRLQLGCNEKLRHLLRAHYLVVNFTGLLNKRLLEAFQAGLEAEKWNQSTSAKEIVGRQSWTTIVFPSQSTKTVLTFDNRLTTSTGA